MTRALESDFETVLKQLGNPQIPRGIFPAQDNAVDALARIRAALKPADAGALEVRRHAGNPKLINIKGLRVVEVPECEGGGYALTGPVAEQIVNTLSAPADDLGALLASVPQEIVDALADYRVRNPVGNQMLYNSNFAYLAVNWVMSRIPPSIKSAKGTG